MQFACFALEIFTDNEFDIIIPYNFFFWLNEEDQRVFVSFGLMLYRNMLLSH